MSAGPSRRLGSLVLLLALAGVVLSCASVPEARPASCAGEPVELGKFRGPAFVYQLVSRDGHGVAEYWMRYRKEYIFPGYWSEWVHADPSQCHGYTEECPCDDCGWGGVVDDLDATYEVEICGPGIRPIHFYFDVRTGSTGSWAVVTAVTQP